MCHNVICVLVCHSNSSVSSVCTWKYHFEVHMKRTLLEKNTYQWVFYTWRTIIMVHHYYVHVVHHKPVRHYQELSSGPPLQAVRHSYIWTRLAGVIREHFSGRADVSPTWKFLAQARPGLTVRLEILAQARPIMGKARWASSRATSLNRAKSRPRSGPAQPSGQKIRPRPGLEAWPGRAWPGNFGPG
jgi:hypothetical protein